jgi:type II secretory pathway pseudopilin PulG
MRKRLNAERGLSLIEVTIMLLVLMLLTSVLAPSIFDFVKDAQWVKVKEDCEAIGLSVARLVKDVGNCLKKDGREGCTERNRVDILSSDGPDVRYEDLASTAVDFYNSGIAGDTINWDFDSEGDSMERQFVTNDPDYPAALGPSFGLAWGQGWRGAYLSPPIGPDPWGSKYLVNTVFLTVAVDAPSGIDEGDRTGYWMRDVFCISPGPDKTFQTAFGGNDFGGVNRLGDDFIYVIQGSTR